MTTRAAGTFVVGLVWLVGLLGLLTLALTTGCARGCSRAPTPTVADASSLDAGAPTDGSADAARPGSPFEPVAFVGWQSRLHLLLDGTLLYTHGTVLERLEPSGERVRLRELAAPGSVGTAAGVPSELFVSTVVENYPVSTDSTAWRVLPEKEERILASDVFYLALQRWSRDRLLGLRVKGAIHWGFDSVPWVPERFVVVGGSPKGPVPAIPEKIFVEDFVAFPSGTVLAVASQWEEAIIGRSGAFALRWQPGSERSPEREPLGPRKETQEAIVQHVAARSENDVWAAGRSSEREGSPAWFSHHDGHEWTWERAPFDGGVKSIAIATDGTLWAIADGMLERTSSSLWRREPFSTGTKWIRVELPDVERATFRKPPPRLKYAMGTLAVDVRRHPFENPSSISASVLEPVQVVARAPDDVWVVAVRDFEGTTTVLFHLGPGRDAGTGSGLLDDVDEEDARLSARALKPDSPRCNSVFVAGGPPTAEAVARIKATHTTGELPVVVAIVEDSPTLGTYVGGTREIADELRTTWVKLGLPVKIWCGRPRLQDLVVE